MNKNSYRNRNFFKINLDNLTSIPYIQIMKIDITHNTPLELMLQTLNTELLSKALEQSFQESDMSVIAFKLHLLFSYTGEQLTAFVEEWKMMYADWYYENLPLE